MAYHQMCQRSETLVVCSAIVIAIVLNYLVAFWIKLPNHTPIYRRIGLRPAHRCFALDRPAAVRTFLAGSFENLGSGNRELGCGCVDAIEWEVFQNLARTRNLMIIGIDLYDLNEYHLCEGRASAVPLAQPFWDLWGKAHRLAIFEAIVESISAGYLQKLFPTAGSSEAVLVGLRRLLPERFQTILGRRGARKFLGAAA